MTDTELGDTVLKTLMEIKEDIGELKAMQLSANANLVQHYADDKAMHESFDIRLGKIETTAATVAGEQKMLRRVAAIGTTFATITAGVIGAVIRGHAK
ncbi:MAG: hypothetical protein ACHQ9S_18890 [Candidatus Binatia bacterium]